MHQYNELQWPMAVLTKHVKWISEFTEKMTANVLLRTVYMYMQDIWIENHLLPHLSEICSFTFFDASNSWAMFHLTRRCCLDANINWGFAFLYTGVIFALKVITTHYLPPGITYVMGFLPVHSRFACWVELVLIQLLVPQVSFVGHLAGILVGLAYVKGPLKTIMDSFLSAGKM